MDLTYISLLLHEFGFPGDKVLKVSIAYGVPPSPCGEGAGNCRPCCLNFYLLLPSLPLRNTPVSLLSLSLFCRHHPASAAQACDILSFPLSSQAGSEN